MLVPLVIFIPGIVPLPIFMSVFNVTKDLDGKQESGLWRIGATSCGHVIGYVRSCGCAIFAIRRIDSSVQRNA